MGDNMKCPKFLAKRDTIGLIAPSGPLRNIKIEEIKYELNKLGYEVKRGKSCYLSYKGYLSGRDKDRALDLEKIHHLIQQFYHLVQSIHQTTFCTMTYHLSLSMFLQYELYHYQV